MNKELKDLWAGLQPWDDENAMADAITVQKLIVYIGYLEKRILKLEDAANGIISDADGTRYRILTHWDKKTWPKKS